MERNRLKISAVHPSDPAVQEFIVKFVRKAKFARGGHIGWIYHQLALTNAITYIITDESGSMKFAASFTLEGKDEAINLLTYSASKTIEEAKIMTEMVKDELRKLGVQKIYSVVWGDYGRGEAAAKLFGGEIVGTYIMIPLDRR